MDRLKPEDLPPGFALIRVVAGQWHEGHFDIGAQARPIADGMALLVVFEGGLTVMSDAAKYRALGAGLGEQLGEMLVAQFETAMKMTEAPGGRVN